MIKVDLEKVCTQRPVELCPHHGKNSIWWHLQDQEVTYEQYQDLLALKFSEEDKALSETFLAQCEVALAHVHSAIRLHRRGVRPSGQQNHLEKAQAAIRGALGVALPVPEMHQIFIEQLSKVMYETYTATHDELTAQAGGATYPESRDAWENVPRDVRTASHAAVEAVVQEIDSE